MFNARLGREKFSPDLHTGTGNFSIPIELPAGRNGFAPRLTLERWEAEGGTRPLADPRRAAELARILERTWNAFIPAERTPGEEAREWYTAESP